MQDLPTTKISYLVFLLVGFGVLTVRWVASGEMEGFFLLLFMICANLARWRIPGLKWSGVIDAVVCAIFYPWALAIALFSAMYYGAFASMLVIVAVAGDFNMAVMAALGGVCGLFLRFWEKERERGFNRRDEEAGRFYELEALQGDLITATAQIERMTVVSERARIAREIHDNAGHEIVAAFISLQTARGGFDESTDAASLRLYDSALERLDAGVNKIREAVHNLAPVTSIGVESLTEICEKFPACEIDFKIFGNTTQVPVHVWNVLESVLAETLTNAAKHAREPLVNASLDVTPFLVRLFVENPRGKKLPKSHGVGLRNLRHRAAVVGGNLSVDASGENFRVVCVIPIKEENI